MAEENVADSTSKPVETVESSEGFGPEPNDGTPSFQKVSDQLDEDNEVNSAVNEIIYADDFTEEDYLELENMDDSDIDNLIDEILDDEGEETETSESEEEVSELPDGETDEIESILSNRAQKRIDKLTAEKKSTNEENEQLKARLAELEAKVNKPETSKEKPEKITDEQIAKVIAKGIEEGDTTVIVDAMRYMVDNAKKDAIAEEQARYNSQSEVSKKQAQEWNLLTKEYSPISYKYESLKNDPDFNLDDRGSLLFRLANNLYDKNGYGGKDGGQSQAVREAYSILLERKLEGNKSKKSPETEGLQNRLAKEQRKKTLGGGSNSGGGVKAKPLSEANELEDYIKSRSLLKNQKLGIDI